MFLELNNHFLDSRCNDHFIVWIAHQIRWLFFSIILYLLKLDLLLETFSFDLVMCYSVICKSPNFLFFISLLIAWPIMSMPPGSSTLAWSLIVTLLASVLIFYTSKSSFGLHQGTISSTSSLLQLSSTSSDNDTDVTDDDDDSSIYVRKEIRDLTSDELDNYFAAIWEYKTNGRQDDRDYFLTYNDIVAQHAIATTNTTVRFFLALASFHFLCVSTHTINQ